MSLLIAAACGTTSTATTGPGANQPLAVAEAGEAPPHVFTPRPHPARQHLAPPAPDLASMPRLVDRTQQCLGVERAIAKPRPSPPPTRKPRKKKKKKRAAGKKRGKGYVPYKDTKPATVAPSGGAPGGTPGGVAGGVVGGVLGGVAGGDAGGASATGSAPPPKVAEPSKPRADKKKERESRRQRRKNDAKAPQAPAEPAPEPEPVAAEQAAPDDDARDMALSGPQAQPLAKEQFDPDDQFSDWGQPTYLSNDDTMSLSSAQRVIYAIDNFLPLPAEHIRPHELLNYFSFDLAPVAQTDDFSVHGSIAPDSDAKGVYSLALGVRGRPMSIDDRRNANVSFVVDRSGSMAAEGRMEFLKQGLLRSLDELKRGDIVHLVLFDNRVCTPVENFVVGRDSPQILQNAIQRLEPRGATDLHAGLSEGYAVTDRAYQRTHTNRVVMITDAQTNSGVTDNELISTVSQFYDRRQIRLSGVGVGSDFNDALLDRLTERGRGAYVFLGSPAEVDAVFGPRFVSLVETTAVDVHFQLHLPPSLRMNVFYGEESSAVKEDVQSIHYFANTSQLFLSDLMARGGKLRDQDDIMLTIEYDEPETGEERIEEYAFNIGEMRAETRNVDKSRLIIHFVDGLAWMASRPTSRAWGAGAGRWDDERAFETCEQGRADLDRMSRPIADDPEVRRVLGLWDKYCARYSRPRNPVRRAPAEDTWPSAAE
ncbi:MAG: VWA domain-containing protein [Myxococcota bacterium]